MLFKEQMLKDYVVEMLVNFFTEMEIQKMVNVLLIPQHQLVQKVKTSLLTLTTDLMNAARRKIQTIITILAVIKILMVFTMFLGDGSDKVAFRTDG